MTATSGTENCRGAGNDMCWEQEMTPGVKNEIAVENDIKAANDAWEQKMTHTGAKNYTRTTVNKYWL